ncbi:MAG: hypothetical protein KDC35_15445 [Acidobacteria bacterium]|nr:hypothetical protein [Acidobacteriota bacterium]
MVTRLLILLLMLVSVSLAQDESAPEYRYLVPFPERTYSGEWQITLELTPASQAVSMLRILGFGPSGKALFEEELGALTSREVATWNLAAQKQELLQTAEIVSDQPLLGTLWLKNMNLNQLNGVSVGAAFAGDLVIPHVATNYFKWKTSLALSGQSDSGLGSQISLNYVNSAGRLGENVILTETLNNYGYLRRTPWHDFLTENVPEMGWVQAADPTFNLNGYMTFSRVEDSLQTCAIEMSTVGSSRGVAIISNNTPFEHDNFFVFSNLNTETVDVLLTVYELSGGESGGSLTQTMVKVSLPPRSKQLYVLGLDLFESVSGLPLAVGYQVLGEGEQVPLSIYAQHLQSNDSLQALAGSNFSVPGDRLEAWLQANSDTNQMFEMGNFGSKRTEFQLTFHASSGETWQINTDLGVGETFAITGKALAAYLELDAETTLPVRISVDRLLEPVEGDPLALAGKVTRFTESDFATISVSGLIR